MIINRHIGAVITRLRKDRKYDWLASYLGVSVTQVKRYESGENVISAPKLLNLAAVFNMTPSALIRLIEEEAEADKNDQA